MTDSAEVKMSGCQTGQEAGLSLEEPIDAVRMASLTQSSSSADAADSRIRPDQLGDKADETRPHAIQGATGATSSAVCPSEAADEESQPRQDKGKEKAARPPSPPAKNDEDDMAIGASTDDIPKPNAKGDAPICHITLLIASGKRHPYKIDEKYLAKRNVSVPGVTETGGMDPFSISVYTLKELILREWRDEWEAKPSHPSMIRLIHFGKLLDDKDQLKRKGCSRPVYKESLD
jgi:ubiquitin-like protein